MPTPRELEMLVAARGAGIASRAELANFMGQVSAESRNLTALEESFAYTRGIDQIPVRHARRNGDAALEDARLEAVRGRPEALADLMYGGRMGNSQPGDGYRYRGRGYIQLTGRDNYRATGQAVGLDLEGNPDLAAEPENAARIAVSFWQRHVPAPDREDVLAATRRINGGTNGLAHRQAQYDRWHAVLTPEFIAGIDSHRPGSAVTQDADWASRLRQTLDDVVQRAPPPVFQVQDGLPDYLRVASSAPAPGPAAGSLQQGARGERVRELQQALVELDIRDGQGRPLAVDGIFGPGTRQAVENFQLWNGLETSGVVDRDTRDLLRDGPRPALASEAADDAATLAHPRASLDPRDPDHPDHALYDRIRAGIRAIGERNGHPYDDASERVSRCLLAECRPALQRVDHVIMGTSGKVFAIEGRLDDPAQRRAWVSFAEAALVPVDASDDRLAQVNRLAAREEMAAVSLRPPAALHAPAPTPALP